MCLRFVRARASCDRAALSHSRSRPRTPLRALGDTEPGSRVHVRVVPHVPRRRRSNRRLQHRTHRRDRRADSRRDSRVPESLDGVRRAGSRAQHPLGPRIPRFVARRSCSVGVSWSSQSPLARDHARVWRRGVDGDMKIGVLIEQCLSSRVAHNSHWHPSCSFNHDCPD